MRGSPSGTATIIMQIERVTASHTAFMIYPPLILVAIIDRINLTMLAIKINIAAYNPHLVNIPPKFSSLIYKGVFEVVSNFSSKIPLLLFFPTQTTTAFPAPETIKDYESRNGSDVSFLKF